MKPKIFFRAGAIAIACALLLGLFTAIFAGPSFAQTPATPSAPAAAAPAAPAAAEAAPPACDAKIQQNCTPNAGDTAWMLTSVALVLMMTIPGLGLFYGGMVRKKNVGDTEMTSFAITCLITVLWVVCQYSLAFRPGTPFIGGLDRAFLQNILSDISKGIGNPNPLAATIPETVYMCFQMTFAIITPALIAGAFAERMKFSAMLWFTGLWSIVVYAPVAHWVWSQDGLLSSVNDSGLLKMLDFAGGTVVHINAGVAGLMCAICLGKRNDMAPPHNMVMTMIGASMLWVGWFGFNAGSALEAGDVAALAFINTLLATAAAAVSWVFGEWITKGKPSMLGGASGAVAGLVAITPACGYVGPMGGLIIGLVAGVVCLWGVNGLKRLIGADDSLDVFGVHGVGGILGALLTGVFAAPQLGGQGIFDYTTNKMSADPYSIASQVLIQAEAIGTTIIWSAVVSLVAYKLVDIVIGLRVPEEQEREGLDITSHGESAYHS
jgi:Amt family ammonium transporter